MRIFTIGLMLCLGMTTGCVFNQRNLQYDYTPLMTDKRSPLSSIESKKIKVLPFRDVRQNPDRIGHKLNSIGIEIGTIQTKKSLAKILRSELREQLKRNGHKLKSWRPAVILSGTVTEFGVDRRMTSTDVEYTGSMAMILDVQDRRRRLIFSKEYRTTYHVKTPALSAGAGHIEISKAIAQLINLVTADRELYDFLSSL